jgi:hypothetical protein
MFNETELKNMLELLQILKFKWQTGMYSGQDVTEAFQDDYETIKKRKEDFNADCDFVYLPFEPNQGLARNVEDISTQPNPQLIAPDGKPMDQKDVMEMQTDQQSQLQDQQNKNAQDMQDDQHDKNIEMQGVQHNNQLEMEKTKAKLAPPIPKMPGGVKNQKKPAGSPGRPSTSGAPPRSDSVDRAPRSGAPSARGMNPQARPKSASLGNFNDESSISDIIRMLDSNIEMLKDQLSKDMGENNED